MITIQHNGFLLAVSEENGSVLSIHNGRREFLYREQGTGALFTIRFRDQQGNALDVCSNEFTVFRAERSEEADSTVLNLVYSGYSNLEMEVSVRIVCPHDEPSSYWRMSIRNRTDLIIDWIDFPELVVPHDLPANGGSSRILWPGMEGVLVDDIAYRQADFARYTPVEYPNKGWEGYYPGPAQIQMMAYYNELGGLYVAAHDDAFQVKAIEYFLYKGGIKLEYRLFPGGVSGDYAMDYDMAIILFDGDWHDAAEMYRGWRENNPVWLPKKLEDNESLPSWLEESPITVIYPVRGQMHLGDMTPNEEFFPFVNALPIMERLAHALDSKLLALPMQWEGTAPWSPPYVWPPLGGAEPFKQFVEAMHKWGHYVGVYCSGISWTNESGLLPAYSGREEFEEKQLINIMCDSPDGSPPRSEICQGPIRSGYDMCPTQSFVYEAALGEIGHIMDSGCDYIQYFDQNLGGASYFCYSKSHGHPPGPGKWQIEAMRALMAEIQQKLKQSNREVVIGCESAAAEPYMEYLPFNDLRFEINYLIGTPVPLYAYIYHEYVNNFMGNQNGTGNTVNFAASPLNLLQRIAYSFVAGDMLSVVLADQGSIHWDWCTPWDVEKPDQQSAIDLIRNLNSWRNGAGKPFLRYGKMHKPFPLVGSGETKDKLHNGREWSWPALFTSRWLAPDGRAAQIVVNYTLEPRAFSVDAGDDVAFVISRRSDGSDRPKGRMGEGNQASALRSIDIAPLSAIMIEFTNDNIQN